MKKFSSNTQKFTANNEIKSLSVGLCHSESQLKPNSKSKDYPPESLIDLNKL